MECSGPPLIVLVQCKIGVDEADLYRAQGKDGVLQLLKSWIDKNTGKVDNRRINLEEMEEQHTKVKQFFNVRKQIQLMPTSPQLMVELLVLAEDTHLRNPTH